MDDQISYFRRRASEERTAAMHARSRPARLAHTAMAERYEDRVRCTFVANTARTGCLQVVPTRPRALATSEG